MVEESQIRKAGRATKFRTGRGQEYRSKTYTKAGDEDLYVISGVRLGDDWIQGSNITHCASWSQWL